MDRTKTICRKQLPNSKKGIANLKAAVEQLVITESPIDAMSYYHFHNDKMLKENTVLISTAGSPGGSLSSYLSMAVYS